MTANRRRPRTRLIVAGLATAGVVAGLTVAVTAPANAASSAAFPFPTHVTYKVGVTPSASQSAKDAAVEKAYDAWKATYLIHGCATTSTTCPPRATLTPPTTARSPKARAMA